MFPTDMQPSHLGFRQPSWRPGQLPAIARITDSRQSTRFSGLSAPTGFGKSLVYLAAAKLIGRTVVLTSTKALQDQLVRDVPDAVTVKGRSEFPCLYHGGRHTAEAGVCRMRVRCPYKDNGCRYWLQIEYAKLADLVITNYAFWLTARAADLRDFDLLVLDEAHTATDWLDEALTVRLREPTIRTRLPDSEDPAEIASWARERAAVLPAPPNNDPSAIRRFLRAKSLLESAAQAGKGWVAERIKNGGGPGGIDMAPIWSGTGEGKTRLFGDLPRVLLTSATLTRKTVELLGVAADELDWQEHEHGTPVDNRRLTWVPTVRVNHRTTRSEMMEWVRRIDQICGGRLDRKGVIHTVSYSRSQLVLERSAYSELMVGHTSGGLAAAVTQYLSGDPPQILVSPAATEGIDLPGDQCRYQVLGKIPYPYTASKVMQARMARDADYAGYLAMSALVQACGRGVRSADDWCENLIIDDNIQWFARRNGRFAPKWFMDGYCERSTIPEPREIW